MKFFVLCLVGMSLALASAVPVDEKLADTGRNARSLGGIGGGIGGVGIVGGIGLVKGGGLGGGPGLYVGGPGYAGGYGYG